MPKGRTLRREVKKPKKKKDDRKIIEPLGVFASVEVGLVSKRRKEEE